MPKLKMLTHTSEQGLEGPIKLSGSTPDLDEFTLKIVDGTNPLTPPRVGHE